MKKAFKETIAITGGNGFLGSHFYEKYKKKYKIIKYPYKIEKLSKVNQWLKNNKFEYFIHFAAITRSASNNLKKRINTVNVISSLNIIKQIQKNKINNFKFFLFISSSHVYGFSKKKIIEHKIRKPINIYGISKKKVEDYLIKNKSKLSFKIGIARIFNIAGQNQKKGFFIPDIKEKILKQRIINNVNKFRDFIHVDDVAKCLELIIRKKFANPINICSGKKINLINLINLINNKYFNKELILDKKRGGDIYGDNSKLKKLGLKKYKNIYQILEKI